VCILDDGIISNPLLQPALDPNDCHRYDPSWPLADSPSNPVSRQRTHGTEMAGAAIYGSDLASILAGNAPYVMTHRLESVRIRPPKPYENERRLFGAITIQSVENLERAKPERLRSFCMAVTADGKDRGKPTSWSGVVDQICAGVGGKNPRLFFISAGNTDPNQRSLYPDSNDTDSIQDPAQAWNAITVGASTDYVRFDQKLFPNYTPLASAGDLSPSSTTSISWGKDWPLKPDFVLEGGNQIISAEKNLVMDPDSMCMLTTAHATSGRLLVDFRDTSAATAQAVRMAAMLQAEYPKLWPETIRALLIHSAEWTTRMRAAFGKTKTDHKNRLRRYGYGIPNLDRARYSAKNALTLVAERSIQPFTREDGYIKTKEMGLHNLPWPKEHLLDLGAVKVTMRVTLSYFIEPKPSRRDGFAKHRYRYQSHGLRFEVKRPLESVEKFKQRVSEAARTDEEKHKAVKDTSDWVLGPTLRKRGSVHSDWWTGTAAELANSGMIAVFPVSGWWRGSKKDWSKQARYSLIVSIQTEEIPVGVNLFTPEIDFYTPVQTAITTAIKQATTAEVEIEHEPGEE
jgi:hypothetical protein